MSGRPRPSSCALAAYLGPPYYTIACSALGRHCNVGAPKPDSINAEEVRDRVLRRIVEYEARQYFSPPGSYRGRGSCMRSSSADGKTNACDGVADADYQYERVLESMPDDLGLHYKARRCGRGCENR